jgi:heme-degrading monooxygenase HmoA
LIARIGYFDDLTPERRLIQDENYRGRFQKAMARQPGFVASFILEQPGGRRLSVSVWNSEEEMVAGAARANSEPLLSGHRGEDIPSADRTELFTVIDSDGLARA